MAKLTFPLTFLALGGASSVLAGPTTTLGSSPTGSPVAQTILAPSSIGGTSTNVAGANMTIGSGLGTGNSVPSQVVIETPALGTASGTTQQTYVPREIIGASKVVSNNTTTTVANVTVANNTSATVAIEYAVEVFNGTDLQYEIGIILAGVNNKGGVFSQNTASKASSTPGLTVGTLTVTWSITGANPALLQVNANSSLVPSAGYPRVTYNLKNLTQQAVVIQ